MPYANFSQRNSEQIIESFRSQFWHESGCDLSSRFFTQCRNQFLVYEIDLLRTSQSAKIAIFYRSFIINNCATNNKSIDYRQPNKKPLRELSEFVCATCVKSIFCDLAQLFTNSGYLSAQLIFTRFFPYVFYSLISIIRPIREWPTGRFFRIHVYRRISDRSCVADIFNF